MHVLGVGPARRWPQAPAGPGGVHGRGIFGSRGSGGKPGVEEFYPVEDLRRGVEGPVVFGLPETEHEVMTKAMAKERYLLRDSDFANLKPYYDEGAQGTQQTTKDEDTPFMVQDIERATLRRYGSEKEFRREQLRREIKRRRRSGRSSISDLPWDPALGKMPESVIHEPVGQVSERVRPWPHAACASVRRRSGGRLSPAREHARRCSTPR